MFGTLGKDAETKTSAAGKPYLRLNIRTGDGDAGRSGYSAGLPPRSNSERAAARQTNEEWRPSGYSYDPRVAIIKDTPGPLEIQEIGMEISI